MNAADQPPAERPVDLVFATPWAGRPPDTRPYQPQHESAGRMLTEMTDHGEHRRQEWQQVGWHGQSGAFYSLAEDPSKWERGSFSPLWLLVENEPVPAETSTPI